MTSLGVITGFGAVTAVGWNGPQSCAAIRAGISRPAPYPDFQVLDAATQKTVPLSAHAMRGYTDGFNLVGAWTRLARGAVGDFLASGAVPEASDGVFWSRTGLLVVCPVPDDNVFLPDEPGGALEMMRDGFVGTLALALGPRFSDPHVGMVAEGHAGTVAAVLRAGAWFAAAEVERVLIVAADSSFDPLMLEGFAANRRLKLPDNPVGLVPGEAGACFLLESPAVARRRGARVLATVDAAAQGNETRSAGFRPTTGAGLTDCLRAVMGRSSGGAFTGDVVLDLNGEPWRAAEWGAALTRLGGRLSPAALHLPGVSVGETGAASGALGVCYGTHLLERRATTTDTVLIVSSSEQGPLGCLALGDGRRV